VAGRISMARIIGGGLGSGIATHVLPSARTTPALLGSRFVARSLCGRQGTVPSHSSYVYHRAGPGVSGAGPRTGRGEGDGQVQERKWIPIRCAGERNRRARLEGSTNKALPAQPREAREDAGGWSGPLLAGRLDPLARVEYFLFFLKVEKSMVKGKAFQRRSRWGPKQSRAGKPLPRAESLFHSSRAAKASPAMFFFFRVPAFARRRLEPLDRCSRAGDSGPTSCGQAGE